MDTLTAWRYWWKTCVLGISATQMLGEALREEDYERAKEIEEHTDATTEPFMVIE